MHTAARENSYLDAYNTIIAVRFIYIYIFIYILVKLAFGRMSRVYIVPLGDFYM